MASRIRNIAAAVLALGTFSLVAVDVAEARRGGSFGSRGMRTYRPAPATRTAPEQAPPVQRSMTPQQPGANQAARTPAMAGARTPPRTGMFSNPLVRGLLLGGLLGALLGFGFGGMGGGMAAILQIVILAVVGMLLFRLFANRRRQQQPAGAAPSTGAYRSGFDMEPPARPAELNRYFATGGGAQSQSQSQGYADAGDPTDEIGVTQADFDAFERLLKDVQTAFGAEDYATLRARTTPEIMSYLAEELSQNATQGLRNEVTDITLDQGDLAEAWREDDSDFATVAMRYSSRDVMRERDGGRIVQGDPDKPTQTTELWTFVRRSGLPWKLSAIQET